MILIVDDEAPIRELLAAVLHDVGYRTVVAQHGHQALEVVAHERPDLIISDLMMPVLKGRGLCQRLKANPATQGIPIILMTSAGHEQARGVPADAYLDKPFDLDEMEALVQACLPRSGTPDRATAEKKGIPPVV
jgi:CheY-like chemotaxis protein